MANPELLTSAEVARTLGYTVQHVRRLVRQGDLRGQKLGRDWVIPRGSVENFVANKENVELPLDDVES